MFSGNRCPCCGRHWTVTVRARAIVRAIERLRRALEEPPAAGVGGPENPPEEAPAAGPIDANREVWSS